MTKPIEFLPAGLEEFETEARRYRKRDPRVARAFALELHRALQLISASPARWPLASHDTRRVLLWKFPFAVVYREEPSRVLIIAVAHQRRAPGYWRDRT